MSNKEKWSGLCIKQREPFKGTNVNKSEIKLITIVIVCAWCVCEWELPLEAGEQCQYLVASYDRGFWDGIQALKIDPWWLILVANLTHHRRRNLHWRIAFILLACGNVCRLIFLITSWCRRAHVTVGGTIHRQMGLCYIRRLAWEQSSKQHFYMVSSSSFCLEFLPWYPLMMTCNL